MKLLLTLLLGIALLGPHGGMLNAEENEDKGAEAEFRKAAEHGDAQTQHLLGYRYAQGKGVPKDATEAVKWYRKAAAQGYAAAQYNLGLCYAQ